MTGKEGNRLIERLTGEVTEPEEDRTDFGARGDRWSALALPVLRDIGAPQLMELTGRKRSTVFDVLAGRALPIGSRAELYLRAATSWADERLAAARIGAASDTWGALYCYAR